MGPRCSWRWDVRAVGLFLLLTAHSAWAESIQGRVISVADGDTLTIVDAHEHQHKIRIAGIDAPERRQAFYEASRQNLAKLTFDMIVMVEWYKKDKYGRLVGKVEVARQDVGLAQVRAGFAWLFRQYAGEQTIFDRSQYESAELEARINYRGLWKLQNPIPPWESKAMKTAP